MTFTRRTALLGGAATLVTAMSTEAAASARIAAVAFDALAVFDTRPIASLAQRLFPEKAEQLLNLWRTRQFEYTWLRTLTGTYEDFWKVTEESLVFAARAVGAPLTGEMRNRLMAAFLELDPWPDVASTLAVLREAGLRVALLSNFSERMLSSVVGRAGLRDLDPLSTDRVRAFKPDPRAYRMALDHFRVPRERVAFVAFGGWDAAGAKAFGFPVYWANRANAPMEELGVAPDVTAGDLRALPAFVERGGAR